MVPSDFFVPVPVEMAPTPIVAEPLIFFFYGVLSPLMEDKPLVPTGTYRVPAPVSDPGPPNMDEPPIFEDVERSVPVAPVLGFVDTVPNPAPPAFLPLSVNGFIFPR
jgi:hypothetical protein